MDTTEKAEEPPPDGSTARKNDFESRKRSL